jgi:hypothetical protein
MAIVLGWFIFAVIVGVAASSRGRSGFGFFILSLVFSPLIGIILVMAMPNVKHEDLLKQIVADRQPKPLPRPIPQKAQIGGRADRVTVDRTPRPFEPAGVFAGVPYRVADDGSIHAIMQGAMVRFRDFEKFTGALGTDT